MDLAAPSSIPLLLISFKPPLPPSSPSSQTALPLCTREVIQYGEVRGWIRWLASTSRTDPAAPILQVAGSGAVGERELEGSNELARRRDGGRRGRRRPGAGEVQSGGGVVAAARKTSISPTLATPRRGHRARGCWLTVLGGC